MDKFFPEIIRQWLGEQRSASNENIDRPTEQAANICGTCQATSTAAKGTEPLNRKERAQYNAAVRALEESALTSWSQANGLWISKQEFNQEYTARKIGEGAEQKVYLHTNGREVIKANTGTYHGNWLEFFNRLLCHAILFPATKYTTVEETFAVIIQQQFALLTDRTPQKYKLTRRQSQV
jgi:hypothetical protein